MKLVSLASAVGFTFLFAVSSVQADPHFRNGDRHNLLHNHRLGSRTVVVRPTPVRAVTSVAAFSLSSLPVGHLRFVHDDETYYYYEGVYYQKMSHGYVIVKPRSGFRVAALPSGYRVIREGSNTFYSFNNVRYRKLDGFFIVV